MEDIQPPFQLRDRLCRRGASKRSPPGLLPIVGGLCSQAGLAAMVRQHLGFGLDGVRELLREHLGNFGVELPDFEVAGVTDFRTLAGRIQARL